MGDIIFNSKEHEDFYKKMMERSKKQDVYHQAFFYCMGVCDETRNHIEQLFDFDRSGIRPENMNLPFQTGTSYKVTRMAFNLWNGYVEEGEEKQTTPAELFACRYGNEFLQAAKLRYPEYYKDNLKEQQSLIDKLMEAKIKTSGQVVHKSEDGVNRKDGER